MGTDRCQADHAGRGGYILQATRDGGLYCYSCCGYSLGNLVGPDLGKQPPAPSVVQPVGALVVLAQPQKEGKLL